MWPVSCIYAYAAHAFKHLSEEDGHQRGNILEHMWEHIVAVYHASCAAL